MICILAFLQTFWNLPLSLSRTARFSWIATNETKPHVKETHKINCIDISRSIVVMTRKHNNILKYIHINLIIFIGTRIPLSMMFQKQF